MTTKERFEELAAKGKGPTKDPNQPQTEEQEVLQKTAAMRETAAAMREGQFPSTKEIASALEGVQKDEGLAQTTKDMSPEGQKFVADTGEALDTAKTALLEKNRDDELQKMLYHATKATEATRADRERLAGRGKAVKSEALAAGELTRQAVDRITNVAKLTVTSSEFRTLLTELTQLFRDIVLTNVTAAESGPQQAQGAEQQQQQQQQQQPWEQQQQQPWGQQQEQQPQGAEQQQQQQQQQQQPWEQQQQQPWGQQQEQQQQGAEHQDLQREEERVSSHMPSTEVYHEAREHPEREEGQQQQQQQEGGEERRPSPHAPSAERHEAARSPQGEEEGREQKPQGAAPQPGEGGHREILKDTAQQTKTAATRQAIEGAQPYLEQLKQGDTSTQETFKDAGRKMAETMRERASGIRLTEEQRASLINRVKNVIREVHTSDEYTQAIEDLLDILSAIKARAASMATTTGQPKKPETADEQPEQQKHLLMAVQNAKVLVERFANDRSLDPLYREIQALMQEMRDDREFDRLASDTKDYLMRALRDVSYVDDPQFGQQGQDMLNRARDITADRYRRTVDRLGNEAQTFLQGFRDDPTTQRLGQSLQVVMHDMFVNEQGRPTIKANLARDLVRLIPVIAQRIKFVPIPRIEGADEKYEYAIDNMVVSTTNILPEHVRLSTQTDITKLPQGDVGYDVNNLLAFSIRNLHATARNVAFYYKKKSGIARMADAGYADIVISGRGLDIGSVVAAGNQNDDERSFQVLRVDTLVHDIDLTMHETKRDLLYKVFGPIVRSVLRKRLEEGIAVGLLKFMVAFDKQITKTGKQSTAFAGDMTDKAKERFKKGASSDDPERARDISSPRREEEQQHTGKHATTQQQHGGQAAPQTEPLDTAAAKGRHRAM